MRGINFCELILQQLRNEFSARDVCQGNGGERRDKGQRFYGLVFRTNAKTNFTL